MPPIADLRLVAFRTPQVVLSGLSGTVTAAMPVKRRPLCPNRRVLPLRSSAARGSSLRSSAGRGPPLRSISGRK